MIVDIDAGNSRLKWVLHDGDIDAPKDRGWVANADIASWLASEKWRELDCVRLVSVAGATAALLLKWAQVHGLEIRVASVVDGTAGVHCGYREPARLGVDRWLALLAARERCHQRCMVVDAGTALTVDVLGRDGVHEGGYIAPGLSLMADALSSGTCGIRVDSPARDQLAPGLDTAQAVGRGCLAAAVGMVAGVARDRRVETVLLTGGDAQVLAGHLEQWLDGTATGIAVEDNLVLRGLGIALPWVSSPDL